MGMDLRECGNGYYDLQEHYGHSVVVSQYGVGSDPANYSIECETCNVVLVSFDRPFFNKEGTCGECGCGTTDEPDYGIHCQDENCENSIDDWGNIGPPT